jgi:hypothetical protein
MVGSNGMDDLAFVVYAGSRHGKCYLVKLSIIDERRQIENRDE